MIKRHFIKSKVLLVEGKDDVYVISNLLTHHAVEELFSIKSEDAVENVLKALPVQLKGRGMEAVGVVLDADLAMLERWDALRDILRKAGYSRIPDIPLPSGTIIDGTEADLPRFGAWIMPDNQLPGMLEHFVSVLVPKADPLFTLAEATLNGIPRTHRRFNDNHFAKAHIHTWLAWQDDPGTPLGLAITKRYLDANADAAKTFVAWLRELFLA